MAAAFHSTTTISGYRIRLPATCQATISIFPFISSKSTHVVVFLEDAKFSNFESLCVLLAFYLISGLLSGCKLGFVFLCVTRCTLTSSFMHALNSDQFPAFWSGRSVVLYVRAPCRGLVTVGVGGVGLVHDIYFLLLSTGVCLHSHTYPESPESVTQLPLASATSPSRSHAP